jgi:PKD repeat protein
MLKFPPLFCGIVPLPFVLLEVIIMVRFSFKRSFFVSLLVVVLALSFTVPAAAGWVTEIVASPGDQGLFATIAVDSTRLMHAAWYDASVGVLYYGYRDYNGWQVTQIDAGNRGRHASIAIDPLTDLPAIAYYSQADNRPKYAWYDGVDWTLEFIGDDAGEIEGDFIDLAFKNDGTPYVSYHYDNGAFHTMGLKVGYRDSSDVWVVSRIDTVTSAAGVSQFGEHTAVAFSTANQPQVAYRGDSFWTPQQKFAWQADSGWDFEATLDFDFAGSWADLALDSGDNVFISSWNTEWLGQECVCVINNVGGSWNLDNVECGDNDFGSWTSIKVDGDDVVHLTYYGDGELRYAVDEGEGWEIVTIDDNDGDGHTGAYTSLALDDRGAPYIAYYDELHHDMRVAYLLDPPDVFTIDPATAHNDAALEDVAITGDLFANGATTRLVSVDGKEIIPGASVVVLSRTDLLCDFDLNGVDVGVYNLEVTNQAGAGVLTDAFTVTTYPPSLTAISPAAGANDDNDFTIQLTGEYFTPEMTVTISRVAENDLIPTDLVVHNTTSAAATFDLTNAQPGEWNVEVVTAFGTSTLNNGFLVGCGTPIANFEALPKQGQAPLPVQFSDRTTTYTGCDLTNWEWSFGDAESSTAQRPQHDFVEPGVYDVSLTVTSAGGNDYVLKTGYITVNAVGDDDDDTVGDDDDDDDDDDNDDDDNSPTGDDDDELTARAEEEDDSSGGCGC